MKRVRTPKDVVRAVSEAVEEGHLDHLCTGDPSGPDRGRVVKVWGQFNPDLHHDGRTTAPLVDYYPVGVDFGSSEKTRMYKSIGLHWPVASKLFLDICHYLFGVRAVVGDVVLKEINQAYRDCEITEVKRTRCRLEYEMPNAGWMGGWHPMVEMFGEKIVDVYTGSDCLHPATLDPDRWKARTY